MSVIGCDIDGCLADFNERYIPLLVHVTGKNLFGTDPTSPAFPPYWDYPQAYGYSYAEVAATWKVIKKQEHFWQDLLPLQGATEALTTLADARLEGHDIYFLTARPGRNAKMQSEYWLQQWGMPIPTVLITEDKATFVIELGIDAYIDDRLSNANQVMREVRLRRRNTRVYLKAAPHNNRPVAVFGPEQSGVVADQRDPALIVVEGVGEMLKMEGF